MSGKEDQFTESEKLTEEELQIWLQHYGLSNDCNEALRRIADVVRAFSWNNNENRSQTLKRLEDAKELLRTLIAATAADQIWSHRSDLYDEFYYAGYKDAGPLARHGPMQLTVVRRSISYVAAALIERPWLESHLMEWIIIDALICDEIRQFGRSILGNPFQLRDIPFVGKYGLRNLSLEKVMLGMARASVIRWLIRMLLLLFLPLAAIWWGVYHEHSWTIVAGIIGIGAYLCWSAYFTVKAIIIKLAGQSPPKTLLQHKLELWGLMHEAYRLLDGPLVDPSRIKNALEVAAEKGAGAEGYDPAGAR